MELIGKYNYINTKEKLEWLDEILMDGPTPRFKLLAVDTETNGLRIHRTTVIGFSVSYNKKVGFYIPLLEWTPDLNSLKTRKVDKIEYQSYMDGCFTDVWTGKTYDEFVMPCDYNAPQFIIDYATRWFSDCNLLMHNAPFDVNMIFTNWDLELKTQVFMDTALLSHIVNENTLNGLKETAAEYKEELGINPFVAANEEQQELGVSIIENGGGKAYKKTIWRAAPKFMNKYACADTFLTFGIFEVLMGKFLEDYGEDMLPWLFEEEVMPLCKEVVIDMKRRGVYIDVPYFKKLQVETQIKLNELEDKIIGVLAEHLPHFTIGEAKEDAVKRPRILRQLMKMEGLQYPQLFDKKQDKWKDSLAKGPVKKAYQENPHWLFGYILGEDEIKYSESKMEGIIDDLYREVLKRRHRFNIGSGNHLRWLFCDRLGYDKSALPQTKAATKDNPIPSMAAEVFEEFFLDDHPWVKDLILWKKLSKLQSTYITPAIELNLEGWLYMDFKQNGTISGRFACGGGFNLQTLPKVEEIDKCKKCKADNIITHTIALLADVKCSKCKEAKKDVLCSSAIKLGFVAPPGYKIINADYSSLEPRCFAFVSGDEKLKEIFWNNLDMYSKVYCDMMGEEYRDLKKSGENDVRDKIKPVVLGIPYGARDSQVANLMGLKKFYTNKKGEAKETLDVEKGKYYRELYLTTYSKLHDYMLRQELQCVTEGFVTTLIGRRRHFVFAPYVFNLLQEADLNYETFLDAKYKDLDKPDALSGALTKEMLKEFCTHFKLKYFDIAQKGFWANVRHKFKTEFNGAKNTPIQGLAGHITNRGMLETTRKARELGIDFTVVLQVHDEITGYSKEKDVDAAVICLRDGMENNIYAKRLDIAMIAEPLIANNLKEAK